MHTLDSRSLRLGNCFGQRFSAPGDVRYFVSAGELIPSARLQKEGGFLIKVQPAVAGAATAQHNVEVKMDCGSLTPSPSKLEIHAGDGVIWHTSDPQVNGFQVSGTGEDFYFSSAHIRNDAVFTHVFGVPGSYEWIDPNGSGVSGTITVEAFTGKTTDERDQWFKKLEKGAGIKIKGKAASPASINILVGQTVFWSIADSAGVAITDKRLYRPSANARG
jgi:plastocyanin